MASRAWGCGASCTDRSARVHRCPVASMVLAWLILFLGSGIAGKIIGTARSSVPTWFATTILALNVLVGGIACSSLMLVFFYATPGRPASPAGRARAGREPAAQRPAAAQSRSGSRPSPRPSPTRSSEATILFADVVDFTPLRRRLLAAAGRRPARSLFSHFDELAERYGLEKIKTIGDAYMVAAGVPTRAQIMPGRSRAWRSTCVDVVRAGDAVGHGLELRVRHQLGPCGRRSDRKQASSTTCGATR